MARPRPNQKSSAKGASKLPKSSFAYPSKRKYPLNTRARARAALRYAARRDTFGSYSHVARKVRARYPGLVSKGGSSRRRTRRRTRSRSRRR